MALSLELARIKHRSRCPYVRRCISGSGALTRCQVISITTCANDRTKEFSFIRYVLLQVPVTLNKLVYRFLCFKSTSNRGLFSGGAFSCQPSRSPAGLSRTYVIAEITVAPCCSDSLLCMSYWAGQMKGKVGRSRLADLNATSIK